MKLNEKSGFRPLPGPERKRNASPVSSGGKELPPIVAETADVIVFCKPSGLPVHPGTGTHGQPDYTA